jgi:hypothetical protein
MSDDFVKNLKKPSAWVRILFMAGFVVALYVSGVILMVLMLAQILFSLLTADDNPNLRRLGASLSSYVAQILAFLTYNTQQKPFPFLPFPSPELPADRSENFSDVESYQPSAADQTASDNPEPRDADVAEETETPAAPRKRSAARRKKPAATDEQDTDV